MSNEDRLKRVHAGNVRFRDNNWIVFLYNGSGHFDSELTWEEWIAFGRNEIVGDSKIDIESSQRVLIIRPPFVSEDGSVTQLPPYYEDEMIDFDSLEVIDYPQDFIDKFDPYDPDFDYEEFQRVSKDSYHK